MFATAIENSCPTIDGGTRRVDEMAKCHHYERWRDDFDCVQQLGLGVLRSAVSSTWIAASGQSAPMRADGGRLARL
jgi:hypothetical protein